MSAMQKAYPFARLNDTGHRCIVSDDETFKKELDKLYKLFQKVIYHPHIVDYVFKVTTNTHNHNFCMTKYILR